MAQSVTSRGHAWGGAQCQGAQNWGNGDQNISATKLNQAALYVRFPKTKENRIGPNMARGNEVLLEEEKSEGSSFAADADADDDADVDANADDADDDCERWFLRRGIGNSRQMWTATWQSPTTARTTIVIFNIFSLNFLKILFND